MPLGERGPFFFTSDRRTPLRARRHRDGYSIKHILRCWHGRHGITSGGFPCLPIHWYSDRVSPTLRKRSNIWPLWMADYRGHTVPFGVFQVIRLGFDLLTDLCVCIMALLSGLFASLFSFFVGLVSSTPIKVDLYCDTRERESAGGYELNMSWGHNKLTHFN